MASSPLHFPAAREDPVTCKSKKTQQMTVDFKPFLPCFRICLSLFFFRSASLLVSSSSLFQVVAKPRGNNHAWAAGSLVRAAMLVLAVKTGCGRWSCGGDGNRCWGKISGNGGCGNVAGCCGERDGRGSKKIQSKGERRLLRVVLCWGEVIGEEEERRLGFYERGPAAGLWGLLSGLVGLWGWFWWGKEMAGSVGMERLQEMGEGAAVFGWGRRKWPGGMADDGCRPRKRKGWCSVVWEKRGGRGGVLWWVAGGDGWRRRNPRGPSWGVAAAWRRDWFRVSFFFYSPN